MMNKETLRSPEGRARFITEGSTGGPDDELCSLHINGPMVGNVFTWRGRLLGDDTFLIHASDDGVPNRFHRLMQRLLLGIRWSRLDEGKVNDE